MTATPSSGNRSCSRRSTVMRGWERIRRVTPRENCSRYPDCDFVTWSEPSKERCPRCGKALFKKKGRNAGLYCLTEGCGYETDGTGAPVEAEKSGKAETPVEKGE